MGWLIASGIICLVLGSLLLLSVGTLRKLDDFCNRIVFYLDDLIGGVRVQTGILLLVIAGWLFWLASAYPELGYFYLLSGFILLFGLLFLVFPRWMFWICNIGNLSLFSTDEAVMASRRTVGMVLIAVSLYIFFNAYRMINIK